MKMRIVLAAAIMAGTLTGAGAQQYTRQQQEAACSDDAFRLCGDDIPDEAKVAACMIRKKAALSQRCLVVFDGSAPKRR